MSYQSPFKMKEMSYLTKYFRALFKVVILPLFVLLILFVGVFSWVQMAIVQEQRRIAHASAMEYLQQSAEGFSLDLMLKDQEAVLLRLEYIRSQTRSRFPLIDVCMEVNGVDGSRIGATCAFYSKNMKVERVKLKIEQEYVGDVKYGAMANISQLGLARLMFWPVIVALTLTILTSIVMLWLIGRYILKPLVIEGESKIRENAINKTVQMIAHDLRRPFSLLQVVLDEIKSANTGEEAKVLAFKHYELVSAARKHSDRMLEDILSSGKPIESLAKTAINMHVFAQKMLVDLSFLRGVKSMPVELIGSKDLYVIADEHKLGRAVMNILSNAIDAAGNNGKIWVKWRIIFNGSFVIEVGNLGSFIPQEARTKIFDSFYSQGKASGTGLGLYIAKRFVDAHGGDVWCASGNTGRTVFKIMLPEFFVQESTSQVVEHHLGDFKLSSAQNSEKTRKKLLIVDDDQVYQDGVERVLRKAQIEDEWDCYTADSAREAMELAKVHKFDACICDYDLGSTEEDGLSVLNQLKTTNRNLVKILHTNRLISHKQKTLMHEVIVVSKPMTVDEILKNLGNANNHSTLFVPNNMVSVT